MDGILLVDVIFTVAQILGIAQSAEKLYNHRQPATYAKQDALSLCPRKLFQSSSHAIWFTKQRYTTSVILVHN